MRPIFDVDINATSDGTLCTPLPNPGAGVGNRGQDYPVDANGPEEKGNGGWRGGGRRKKEGRRKRRKAAANREENWGMYTSSKS